MSSWERGRSTTRLEEGTDHLTFTFLDFRHSGHAFHLSAAAHANTTAEDCPAYHARRVLYPAQGTKRQLQ